MKYTSICGVLAGLALAGCITTQELPLAPNVVRLDTQSKGLLFTGQTVPQTMRAAAQATLNRGYTHFKLKMLPFSKVQWWRAPLEAATLT